ncbi:pollen-specific leucine-rich repeat extensin-like protein 4 [Xenopus tropicalis]|uniref:Pollen-specific leucine-rich repeat extensin-like protein 4 n=1 Tax=Xenopus tropicalis TaxID=8364 RepID=A0A8J1IMW0_XENTR|nr:pollen-specific leucine-rich repeat extensin-like protein 4 [Xenopus tropicalis]
MKISCISPTPPTPPRHRRRLRSLANSRSTLRACSASTCPAAHARRPPPCPPPNSAHPPILSPPPPCPPPAARAHSLRPTCPVELLPSPTSCTHVQPDSTSSYAPLRHPLCPSLYRVTHPLYLARPDIASPRPPGHRARLCSRPPERASPPRTRSPRQPLDRLSPRLARGLPRIAGLQPGDPSLAYPIQAPCPAVPARSRPLPA